MADSLFPFISHKQDAVFLQGLQNDSKMPAVRRILNGISIQIPVEIIKILFPV